MKINVEETLKAMQIYEGFEIQEAKLTYKAREDLPEESFCGPNRTYPTKDAAHVGSAYQRLAQFGHRMPQSMRAKIMNCLGRKAKRFSVEHDAANYKWKADGSANVIVRETIKSKIAWYLKELGIE